MLPSRYVPAQSSAMRKSRLEGKPSLLPKPRRPGSTDRLSTEARRPSAVGHRSSSADPPRATFGGRLSREASATKLPNNGRSRSQQQQGGQTLMTPLRSSQYSNRATTTPVRTPSEDRMNRSWQTSLDRALGFVTIKDQRPVSNAGWQRAECSRVQKALAERSGVAQGGGLTLIRPLSITRFVEISGSLIGVLIISARLNNDNYVAMLPHLSKRLLYPGVVSKSWLKTVNTLHAYPHALALISYLLDMVNYIETPILEECLYVEKDPLACLRRDYLYKCWIRFQEPEAQFEDLNEEYLQDLAALLGNTDEKYADLQNVIKIYTAELEDEAEAAARAHEARVAERREALRGALRAERAARRAGAAAAAAQAQHHADCREKLRLLDVEIERAHAESQQLRLEVERQALSVAERTRLLDEVDYAHRVRDSKRNLADQISKMVLSKETELALWQKKTLDSCVEYKQGLIHLSAQFPHLAALAIEEKELMGSECATCVSGAVEALRECSARLGERRAEHARSRTALARKRAALLEETRSKISELKTSVHREQQSLEAEVGAESGAAAAWGAALRGLRARLQDLRHQQQEYERRDQELDYWEHQEQAWRTKLSSMREYIETQRVDSQRILEAARAKRLHLVLENIALLRDKVAI